MPAASSQKKPVVQSQAGLFWAVSRMGLRPNGALLDKASLVLQQKDIQAQVHTPKALRFRLVVPDGNWYIPDDE